MINGYHSFIKLERWKGFHIVKYVIELWRVWGNYYYCIKLHNKWVQESNDRRICWNYKNYDFSEMSNGEEVKDITEGIPNVFVQHLDFMTMESKKMEILKYLTNNWHLK